MHTHTQTLETHHHRPPATPPFTGQDHTFNLRPNTTWTTGILRVDAIQRQTLLDLAKAWAEEGGPDDISEALTALADTQNNDPTTEEENTAIENLENAAGLHAPETEVTPAALRRLGRELDFTRAVTEKRHTPTTPEHTTHTPPLTPDAALIRLTHHLPWSTTAAYGANPTEKSLAEIALTLAKEVERLRPAVDSTETMTPKSRNRPVLWTQVTDLQHRAHQAENQARSLRARNEALSRRIEALETENEQLRLDSAYAAFGIFDNSNHLVQNHA